MGALLVATACGGSVFAVGCPKGLCCDDREAPHGDSLGRARRTDRPQTPVQTPRSR